MKKALTILIALAFVFGVFGATSAAQAQGARGASWVVSVTYANVGTAATDVQVNFYEEGSGTAISFDPLDGGSLGAGAGRSFFIGKVGGIDTGFRGSAVMASSQPLVATVVQFSQDSGFKMRLLSNGFQGAQSSDTFLLATTLANTFSRTTVFSVQNTEAEEVTATIEFFDGDGNSAGTKAYDIPAYSTKYVEMDKTADTGLASSTFNGSAKVTAVLKSDGTTAANVVAGISELYTNRNVAANFEGIADFDAADTIYMSTGLCENFGLDTFYAVQNAGTADTWVRVTYYDKSGNEVAVDGDYQIGPGQKKSIRTCDPNDGTDMSGFSGAAVVESYTTENSVAPPDGEDLVAIGKAQGSANAPEPGKEDVFAIFMGQKEGFEVLALPFVRWASDTNFNDNGNVGGKQRAYIAIQNLESSQISVDCDYSDKDGNVVATHTLDIPANSKANTNASLAGALGQSGMNAGEFGYYTDGSFGGAVICDAGVGNAIIAIARVQHPGAGEDYNGAMVP
jgi:hypothetical protein